MDGYMSSVGSRIQTESDPAEGSYPSCSSSSSIFRRIQFHPARKPFNGFANAGSDFKIETLNPGSDANRTGAGASLANLGGKKSDGSDSLESGLDPELSFGITVRKIGAGLENLGNTCFLNSVLQCLTYTEPLAAYLQSGKHQNSCNIAGFCALCAIQKHVSRALQATGRILAPKDLVSNLRCVSRNFRNSRQEDAHEYMINLLESMHKCCLPSGVPSESPSAYERSLVHRIFGGRLRSQVKCMQCSHCSNKFDPFLDLSLDIMKADTMHKALSHFATAELLDDGAKVYQCERCKQKVKAVKQLTVHKAPYVLTVHLKRFRAHDSGKIDKKVQYGCTIDMKPFVSGPYEGDLKYTLYGVLVHYGWSIHSGHYVCFVRTSSGMWYCLDDNRVVQVNERTVLDQKAYMLFYVRDRKNTMPKRPIQVIQKEQSKPTINTNKNYSTVSTTLTEQTNGLTNGKCISIESSATMPRDPNGLCPSKSASGGENSSLEVNVQRIAKAAVRKKDSVAKPSTIGASQKSQPEASGLGSSCDSNIPKPESIIKFNASCSNSIDVATSRNKEQSLASMLSNGKSPHDKTLPKNNSLSMLGSCSVAIPGNLVDSTLKEAPNENPEPNCETAKLATPSNIDSCENSQPGSTFSIKLRDEVDGNGVTSKAPSSNDLKMGKAPKRSHKVWSGAKNMQASFKFFKLSLGLHKKKKHKRSRRRSTLEIKNLADELLLEPSTSEASSRTVSRGKAHLGKEHLGKEPLGKERKANGGSSTDAPVGELKERTNHNGSVLASENNNANCRKDNKRGTSQKEMMNMLTRGLEETVVATWDCPESPQIVQAKGESISIGYVADEWDEDYDRGKRKKIRSNKRHNFSGPNPFQLIASKKFQQRKKPKLDPSVPADTSFRI